MSQFLRIHPQNPPTRLIRTAADVVRAGGVVAYPTDSSYALGCAIGNRPAADRIQRIRKLDKAGYLTLVCRDLSEISAYTRVENWMYRLLKSYTPGPYTFILRATRDVPKRMQDPKRKTVGIRVPAHPVPQALLEALGEPLMSSTLWLPGDDMPLTDAEDIRDRIEHQLDAIIDGGTCSQEPTSVIDLTGDSPVVVRAGRGDVSALG